MSCIKHSQPVNAVGQPAALLQETMEAICKDKWGKDFCLQAMAIWASQCLLQKRSALSHKVCLCSLRRLLFSVVSIKSSKGYSITLLHRLLSERQACWNMRQACRQNTYRFVPGMTAHKHGSVSFLAAMAFGSYTHTDLCSHICLWRCREMLWLESPAACNTSTMPYHWPAMY